MLSLRRQSAKQTLLSQFPISIVQRLFRGTRMNELFCYSCKSFKRKYFSLLFADCVFGLGNFGSPKFQKRLGAFVEIFSTLELWKHSCSRLQASNPSANTQINRCFRSRKLPEILALQEAIDCQGVYHLQNVHKVRRILCTTRLAVRRPGAIHRSSFDKIFAGDSQ